MGNGIKTQAQIAKWLEDISRLIWNEDEPECASTFIRENDYNLSLSVGWIGGYDDKSKSDDFSSKKDPSYRVNAAIVKYNISDCCDLQFMEMPYDPKTGCVYDTQCTLGKYTDWYFLAHWYIKEYNNIIKEIKKGTLV